MSEPRKLPEDLTKTALADTIARRARLSARANSKPVTRLLVEEVMNEMQHAPRYEGIEFPSLRTVIAAVNRQEKQSP